MVPLARARRRREGSPSWLTLSMIVALVVLSVACRAGAHDGFAVGERVDLYVNKLGPSVMTFRPDIAAPGVPAASLAHRTHRTHRTHCTRVHALTRYNNPQETYSYYSLPFCRPSKEEPKRKWSGLGEVLQGNELLDSQLEVRFRTSTPVTTICKQTLSALEASQFEQAVAKHYWFEMFMDGLPIWGFVGPPPEHTDNAEARYVYTHRGFDIAYNGNQIIHVNLTSDNPVLVAENAALEWTYEVNWVEREDIDFDDRFQRYLDYSFFENQIHWFSVFNSFMMVVFLLGLVSMILLRTLRKDYARYTVGKDDLESLELDMNEETGWKLVHGDVFRSPVMLELFAAVVGTGVQLAALVLLTIVVTIAAELHVQRGTIVTVFVVFYALTSLLGGYASGSLYSKHDGRSWIRAMLLTANLFPLTVAAIAFTLNTIAIFYQSMAEVPFGTILVVLLMWVFVSCPLCLLGTVAGRNQAGGSDNPCRVKRIPSPIPQRPWYLSPVPIAVMGGLLPFGSIFIEMYFVFSSFWNYRVYYVYGFFLLVFLILLMVTACITIVATYFLLNAENYHWQWTSFGAGASTAMYVFLYSVHYFTDKTNMTGFFQTAFYFGYTSIFCVGLGMMCGAVGYLSSAAFVKRIYKNIKCD